MRCSFCNGAGSYMGNGMMTKKCPMCYGDGFIKEEEKKKRVSKRSDEVKKRMPEANPDELDKMIAEEFEKLI